MRAKSSKVKIYPAGEHPDMIRQEVNKLGRPYHRIPKLFRDMQDYLDGILGIYFLKKYRVNITLESLNFEPDVWKKNTQIFSSNTGNLAIEIDRTLLLSVLHDYYGLKNDPEELQVRKTLPVTRTEDRLKNKLAHELMLLITESGIFNTIADIRPDPSSLITQWAYRIYFSLTGYPGGFSLLLDSAHIDSLLAQLRQQSDNRQNAQSVAPTATMHSFKTLPVRLTGRVTTLPLTVADLLTLSSGDILPATLAERVPLYIGNKALFQATIAEEHGKLFFTELTELSTENDHD